MRSHLLTQTSSPAGRGERGRVMEGDERERREGEGEGEGRRREEVRERGERVRSSNALLVCCNNIK